MTWRSQLLSLIVCIVFTTFSALPCTTFVLQGKDRLLFGRNFDWFSEDALVLINPRGVEKTAFLPPGMRPAKWTAKYGSLTFNSGGWEVPTGGMNEVGLVVEVMWLDETEYPGPDSRPGINAHQWVQYQLDNCRTVAEVLDTDSKLRIVGAGLPVKIHYLVCDATSDCASIEFLNGSMVVHRGKELSCRALANDPYQSSSDFFKANPEPEGTLKVKADSSLRFRHAAARSANFKSVGAREDVDYAYETLDQVAQGSFTVWRLVYDISARQIHYRIRSHPQERVLNLKQMDFACGPAVRFFDLRHASEETPQFQTLTEAKHRQYGQAYMSQGWVKQQLGDMTLFMEALLLHLRGYGRPGSGTGAGVSLVPEAAVPAQVSAAEILSRALVARGGKEAASKIQSYHGKGTLELAGGKEFPAELFAMRPGKFMLVADITANPLTPAGKFQMGTDGHVAWEAQPGASPHLLKGAQADERLQGAQFFADYDDPEDCSTSKYLGEMEFDGRKCHVLRLAKKSGEETTHYFDAASRLLVRSLGRVTIADASGWQMATYSDFQPVAGFQFATVSRYRTQHSDVTGHFPLIEVNGVERSVFDLPVGVGATGPN